MGRKGVKFRAGRMEGWEEDNVVKKRVTAGEKEGGKH
jgi:hypothetical protein